MGEVTARHIEKMLQLPLCWMDMPATQADHNGTRDPREEVAKIFDRIPEDRVPVLLNVMKAFALQEEALTTQEPSLNSSWRKA